MGRVARRRSIRLRVRPFGVGALFVVLAWGAVAWGAAVAHAEAPTVTFHGGPLAPALCPAAPDRSNLDIAAGTWVNVVNRTGAKATLEVDGSLSQTIAKNAGLSVMLPSGRHDLRLIPHCPAHGTMLPVVIEVAVVQSGGGPAPSPSPAASSPVGPPPSGGPAGSGGYPDGRTGGGTVPAGGSGFGGTGVGGSGTGGSGIGGAPVVSGSPGPPGAPGSDGGSSGSGGSGADRAVGIVVVPYAVAETEDARGVNLLAVIATICVFGVTVAIIRAILAQRTTRMVRL
jgi:hypothetical protein